MTQDCTQEMKVPQDIDLVLEEHNYTFSDTKKQYIIGWLMDTMGSFKHHQTQDSELCTCNTDDIKSLKSSQLDFWGLERQEKRPKSFFDALKNIFKKKKSGEDDDGSSEEESDSGESEGENEDEERAKEEEEKRTLFRAKGELSVRKGLAAAEQEGQQPIAVPPTDSFITKIQLVQKHLKPSHSPTLVSSSESSIKGSLGALSAYTKEFTGVPYLKKTERVEWQDKNRENRYRLSSLVHRYKTPESSAVSKSPRRVSHCKPPTRQEGSVKEQGIEAIFAKEHMNKKFHGNLKQVFKSGQVSCATPMTPNGHTQAWHEAVNRVRENMRTLERKSHVPSKISEGFTVSDDEEGITPCSISRAHSRLQFSKMTKVTRNPKFKFNHEVLLGR